MTFDPNTGLPVGTVPPVPPAPGAVPPAPAPVVVQIPPPPPAPAPQLTNEDIMRMIENARKEEKDKLYPQLDELKQKVAAYDKEREDAATEAARLQAEAEEADRLKREGEMSAKELIEAKDREWEERFKAQREELDRERILRAKEAEFSALIGYKVRRISEEADNIEPRLVDFITGNTETEIEASITVAKAKTAEIRQDIEQAMQGQRRALPLPVTGAPAVDMAGLGEEGQKALTVDDLRNLSMEDYAALRPQLLGAAGQRVRQQGAYAP